MSDSPIRVLVIEDEMDLQEAMVTYLNMEDFVADGVGSLAAAQQWLRTHTHDMLVLDLGLPDGDGLAWLNAHPALREKGVIMTTARGSFQDRIAGIKDGADTYLVKPIQLEELAFHLRNLGRRMHAPRATESQWEMNVTDWSIQSPEGHTFKLTHNEHKLLLRLAQSPGIAVSRQDLIKELGHDPDSYDPRRMEILVRRLRSKGRAAVGNALPIETVHGLGYSFIAPIRLKGLGAGL